MEIGVYGLGRFGGFWASQLAAFHTVFGWSRSKDRPTPPGVLRVSEKECLAAPVVMLCVAISAMEEVLERIAGRLRPGTLVMDTCSVKVYPASLMLRLLPPEIEILATHPMFGPDSGVGGIASLPMVFSPLRVDESTARFWRANFKAMGLKVIDMDPRQHDEEAAFSQGITHFIGRVLGELRLNPSMIGTAAYRDLLEIVRQTCNDPWDLFVDLQRFNPHTAAMRSRLRSAINLMLDRFESIELPEDI